MARRLTLNTTMNVVGAANPSIFYDDRNTTEISILEKELDAVI